MQIRKSVGVLAAALLAVSLFGVGLATARQVAALNEADNPVKNCLSQHENPRMAVLFLIDESRSLTKSDPQNRRVDAVATALSALSFNLNASQSLTDAKPLSIDVGLVGFSKNFENHNQQWTSLSQEDNSVLIRGVENYRSRNTGGFTNYQAALEGAERTFVEYERKQSGASVCKVLVWLTDGSLDLDNSASNTKKEDNQKASICKSNSGVIDRLRGQEVFTIGLGLSSGSKPDFGFMSKIVAGGCGARDGLGRFTEVETANDLINELFKNLTGSESDQLQPCLGEESNPQCAEVRFNVRPPLNRVYALVGLPPGIESASVIPPSGEKITFAKSGKAQVVDQALLHSTPSFDLSTVLKMDVENVPGQWSIQFRGNGVQDAIVSSVFFSDVQVEILGKTPLRINRHQPTAILAKVKGFSLEGLDADNVTTAFDSTPVLRASLVGGDKQINPIPVAIPTAAGSIDTYSIQLTESDLKDLPSNAQLTLTPEAVLSGHSIVFQSVTSPIVLRFGDGLPSVVKVTASNVDGKNKSKFEIKIAGPEEGTGHARVVRDSFKLQKTPADFDSSKVKLEPQSTTADVAAGSVSVLSGFIDPGEAANGRIGGTVRIELEGENGEREIVPVTFSFNMTNPFSVTKFLWVLVLMLVLFLAIQALVLFFISDRFSRIAKVPEGTWVALFTVQVRGDGQIEIVPDNDWKPVFNSHSRPIDTESISGARSYDSYDFGAFRIAGKRMRGLKVLIGGNSSIGVENLDGVVIGSAGLEENTPETGFIAPSLAGQWVLRASHKVALRLNELAVRPDESGIEFMFPMQVLYFIDTFDPLDLPMMTEALKAKLEFAPIRENLAKVGGVLASRVASENPESAAINPPPTLITGDDIYR